MNKLNKIILVITGILFLLVSTGCATRYPNIKPGTSSIDFTKNGAVVGSVQETTTGRLSGGIYFYYQNIGSGAGGTLATRNPFVGQDNDFGDTKKTRGGVFAIALPPGSYEFNDWLINNGTGADISPRNPKKASFLVEAGEVTYIGNLNMLLRTGKNLLGLEIISGGRPVITNQADRDISIIKTKYPFLANKEIKVNVVAYGK